MSEQCSVDDIHIDSPILIIHGECDDIVPLDIIEHYASMHDNVKLEILHGADHRFKNSGEIERIIGLTLVFLDIR